MIIPHLQQLVRQLRSNRKNNPRVSPRNNSSRTPDSGNTLHHIPTGELEQHILRKIRQLDPNSEDFHSSGLRFLIESALEWEYGPEIYQEPDIEGVIKKTLENITGQPDLYQKYCSHLEQMHRARD